MIYFFKNNLLFTFCVPFCFPFVSFVVYIINLCLCGIYSQRFDVTSCSYF
jgi:hypothetical protein